MPRTGSRFFPVRVYAGTGDLFFIDVLWKPGTASDPVRPDFDRLTAVTPDPLVSFLTDS